MLKKFLFSFLLAVSSVSFAYPDFESVDVAWLDDFDGDSINDLNLSPLLVVPGIAPYLSILPGRPGMVLCGNGGDDYASCHEGRMKSFRSRKFDIFKTDINSDGYLDLVLVAKFEGGDTHIILGGPTDVALAATIKESRLQNGTSLKGLPLEFLDINGDGIKDIVVPGLNVMDDQVVFTYSPSVGTIEFGKIMPRSLAATSLADNEIKAPNYPKALNAKAVVTDLGGLSLSVPLDLPVRGRGLTPSIALQYSAGNSGMVSAGAGWSIAGVPLIHRCNRSYYYDGNAGGYGFTENYSNAGGGEEAICGRNGRLVGAKDGFANGVGYAYLNGGNSWYKDDYETLPDGTRYHYKSVASTVIYAPDSIRSPFGETMSLSYVEGANFPVLDEINYYDVKIKFNYVNYRPYQTEMGAQKNYYFQVSTGETELWGDRVVANGGYVLSGIDVYVGDEITRTYVPDYQSHSQTGELTLSALQECALDNQSELCGVPVRFSYLGEGEVTSLQPQGSATGAITDLQYMQEVDWDNDGVLELLTLEKQSSGSAVTLELYGISGNSAPAFTSVDIPYGAHSLAAIDLFDDDLQDMLYLHEASGVVTASVPAIATIDQRPDRVCSTLIVAGVAGSQGTSCSYRCPANSTLQGDGFCRGSYSASMAATVHRSYWTTLRQNTNGSTNTSYVSPSEAALCFLEDDFDEIKADQRFPKPTVVDWDGDGYQDVLLPVNKCGEPITWKLVQGTASGLEPIANAETLLSQPGQSLGALADVNGDGEADLIVIEPIEGEEGKSRWKALVEDRSGAHRDLTLSASIVDANGLQPVEDIPVEYTLPADINADGRTDFISAQQDATSGVWKWYVYFGTGVSFSEKVEIGLAPELPETGIDRNSAEAFYVRLTSYDGDKFPDLIAPASKNPNVLSVYLTRFTEAGALSLKEVVLKVPVPERPEDIRIADYDMDGVPDIGLVVRGTGTNPTSELTIYRLDREATMALSAMEVDWPAQKDITEFAYERIGPSSAAYTYQAASAGRNKTVPVGHHVVRSITSKVGTQYESTNTYSYDSLVANAEGLGIRGFLKVSIENDVAETLNERIFSNGTVAAGHVFNLTHEKITDTSLDKLLTEKEYFYSAKMRSICYGDTLVVHDVGAPDGCPTTTVPGVIQKSAYYTPLEVERTTQYLRTGTTPVSVQRKQYEYDERGMRVGVLTQTGAAQGGGSCSSPETCLLLDAVIHEVAATSTPVYPSLTNGEKAYGPFFQGVSAQSSQASWVAMDYPTGISGASQAYGQSVDALTAAVTAAESYPVLKSVTTQGPLFYPLERVVHPGTNQAKKISTNISGARIYSVNQESISPAPPLQTKSGDVRKSEVEMTYYPPVAGQDDYVLVNYTLTKGGSNYLRDYVDEYSDYYRQTKVLRDENGFKTITVFDSFENPVSVTSPNKALVSMQLDLCDPTCASPVSGAVWSKTVFEAGSESVEYYDIYSRPIARKTNDLAGNWMVSATEYDAKGRVAFQSQPYKCAGACDLPYGTTYTYDESGEQVTTVGPDGGVISVNRAPRTGGGVVEFTLEQIKTNEEVSAQGLVSSASSSTFRSSRVERDVLGNQVVIEEVYDEPPGEPAIASTFVEHIYSPTGQLVWSRVNKDDLTVVVRKYDLDGNLTDEYDPSAGHAHFEWSVLGELLSETYFGLDNSATPARGFTYYYDAFGRNVERVSTVTGQSVTYAYALSNTTSCRIGMLCDVKLLGAEDPQGARPELVAEHYTYNIVAGVASATMLNKRELSINAPGESAQSFEFNYTYTASGMPETVTYPNGHAVKYEYANGLPQYVKNAANDSVYWEAQSYDAYGAPDAINLGNGLHLERISDPATGRLAQALAYLPGSPDNKLQNSSYGYDSAGRMNFRMLEDTVPDASFPQKNLRHMVERFSHDKWDRLTDSGVTNFLDNPVTEVSETYAFDALGNITDRSGIGAYAYGSDYQYAAGECTGAVQNPGPHAVKRANGVTYCYNNFGELVSAGSRTYGWNADNTAPVSIQEGSVSQTFMYGSGGEKAFQNSTDGVVTSKRWFAGEGYELEASGAVVTQRIYLGDYAVTEFATEASVTTTTLSYILRDHLGSSDVVVDDDATDGASVYDSVIDGQSFAPFGQRRDVDWVGAASGAPALDEGYTGHQMLDQFNLIHMNGRVYDPAIGRFLSPDIVIQSPGFSQSYNRYSYVMNGPLMGVDPSGYEACPAGVAGYCIYASAPSVPDIPDSQLFPGSGVFVQPDITIAQTNINNFQAQIDYSNTLSSVQWSVGALWACSGCGPFELNSALAQGGAPITSIEANAMVLGAGLAIASGGALLGAASASPGVMTFGSFQLGVFDLNMAATEGGPVSPMAPIRLRSAGAAVNRTVEFTEKGVRHAFDRHHKVFGLSDKWKTHGEEFKKALVAHINDPATEVIQGTYHRQPAHHFYNRTTGINLIRAEDMRLWSVWRLSPAQRKNLLTTGNLGGGRR